MKLSSRSFFLYVILPSGIALILIALFVLSFGTSGSTQNEPLGNTDRSAEPLRTADIESIAVHSGLDIQCPDLLGVAQHGYVYTVSLTENRVIERLGCGVGEPEVFAAAIAADLNAKGYFADLDQNYVLDKLTFHFYEPISS